ncbi:hypothetical protein GCM10023080_026540 [Streptomyces pseudoechinosporeus]
MFHIELQSAAGEERQVMKPVEIEAKTPIQKSRDQVARRHPRHRPARQPVLAEVGMTVTTTDDKVSRWLAEKLSPSGSSQYVDRPAIAVTRPRWHRRQSARNRR